MLHTQFNVCERYNAMIANLKEFSNSKSPSEIIEITELYEQRIKAQKQRAKSIVSGLDTGDMNNHQVETLESIVEYGVKMLGDRMEIKRHNFEQSKYGKFHITIVFGLKHDKGNGLSLLRKHTYFSVGKRGGITTFNRNGTVIKGSKAYRAGFDI